MRAVPKIAAATAALLLLAAPARADLLPGVCAEGTTTRPFLPWADPMLYVLAPDGGLEAGGAGWALTGGAAVQGGNERFKVGGPADSRSLRLPAGASATTPSMCAGLDRPTVRFFARSARGSTALLEVEVVSAGMDTIAVLAPTGEWQPTAPLPILADALDGTMAFRFTALRGEVQVDDVYVDPYGRY